MFLCCYFFFFNDTATTEIYTLSLHDALPIFDLKTAVLFVSLEMGQLELAERLLCARSKVDGHKLRTGQNLGRSEEHTSELQSRQYLVCRLLLEKKKNNIKLI